MLFTVPSTGGCYLRKTILFSGFKNPFKNILETRKLVSIHKEHFVERKNEGRKPDKNPSMRASSVFMYYFWFTLISGFTVNFSGWFPHRLLTCFPTICVFILYIYIDNIMEA
jgi:hypothetical protein